ncbi:MAG TPA: carboxylating nicotinate-nucleotide diphosphorylase [Candidatus Polarisedimenticolaceae bacterium]|nr:carboxylating nicotinate-nucleotide diphosphorylase [Candidatus Polarisedimenticolaceae bacterium]
MPLDPGRVRAIVAAALAEDLGAGDVTSLAVVAAGQRARARLVARVPLVVAGLDVAAEVFRTLDPAVEYTPRCSDGERVAAGTPLAELRGAARAILSAERTALNFLMRMCGIASAARTAVDELAGTGTVVLDTRKTAPGLRVLDKYAVSTGGAKNHRQGLDDAVLIKDTHLAVCGSIAAAVAAARAHGHAPERVTVEVESLAQLREAIAAGAGRAILDNMDLDALRSAVAEGRGRIVLEASGGLRPGSLRAVAATGVDCMSLGWLTHSAPAADLALELEPLS